MRTDRDRLRTGNRVGAPGPFQCRNDDGVVLVLVLTVTMVLASIGLTLLLLIDVEATASSNQRDGVEVQYAVDGALDFTARCAHRWQARSWGRPRRGGQRSTPST
jgi:hypothetical protein